MPANGINPRRVARECNEYAALQRRGGRSCRRGFPSAPQRAGRPDAAVRQDGWCGVAFPGQSGRLRFARQAIRAVRGNVRFPET